MSSCSSAAGAARNRTVGLHPQPVDVTLAVVGPEAAQRVIVVAGCHHGTGTVAASCRTVLSHGYCSQHQ